MSTLPLASEFPAVSHDQWLKLVDGVLKGADFDKRLVGKTYDGIAIQPLQPRLPQATPLGRAGTARPWIVSQRIDDPDPARGNAQALDDLMNGANALSLVFADSPAARGFGLPDASRETLTRTLASIELAMGVTLDLDVGQDSKDAGEVIAALARSKGLTPDQLDIKFGFNPFGVMAEGGDFAAYPWDRLAGVVSKHVSELLDAGFKGPFLVCDGRMVHAAGGTEAQELAFVLASAAAYLRALEASGMALAQAFSALYVRLAADADQFLTIAKLRAMRSLWARLAEACGVQAGPLFIAAETAWRMQTRIDPQVNILRNTVAVFAAAVGGADMISVLPHSAATGLPDAVARRLARNTQVVLSEESNLYRVLDPAAGSGAVEIMTQDLAAKAWTAFQAIEATGGIVKAIQSGSIAEGVAATREARLKAVSSRKDPLTGASEFPNVAEAPVPVLAPMPAATPAPSNGLAPMRLSEPFEALRAAADAATKASGTRPRVFLANLGSVSDFTARTIFAKNFYEAGGFEAPANNGFASEAEMVAAAKASGAKIAVLCSSDAVYAADATRAAKALTAAGLAVALAGRPGELEAELKAAGVRQFVFAGADVVATLRDAHRMAGV
jgi:methylmalonyl-CoA mutase